MDKPVFLAAAAAIFFVAFPAKGLCQGVAEYSISTSGAAASTVKVGSALENATQRIAGGLGEKLSKSTDQPRKANPQPSRSPADRPAPTKAQLTPSIKGLRIIYGPSETNTTETKQKVESPSGPCVSSHGEGSASSKANLPCKPQTQEKYPSVVTLSFSK